MDHLKLTPDALSVEAISDLVVDNSCGAVSIFVGTTRDNFEGKKVVRLEYEAYESMALTAMKAICQEVRNKWPAVHSIAMYHRLGEVPCREASVVIAVSSPHRRDSLDAVAHCIDELKATVPIWKREVYADAPAVWKENSECPSKNTSQTPSLPPPPITPKPENPVDRNLVQINVTNEELEQRIQNFIERKREQVNISNIQDFILAHGGIETEDTETCARVRTRFVKRNDSKGHLKIRRVNNEWGPQTVQNPPPTEVKPDLSGLPLSIAERVLSIEQYLSISPVAPDIFRRLKDMEDKIADLQALSPEYAQFWQKKTGEVKQLPEVEYMYSSDDIARKIEMLERQAGG